MPANVPVPEGARLSTFTELTLIVDIIMMTSANGNIFRVTGPLWGESTAHLWIPLTKASEAEPWCFLWSALEQTLGKQSWRPWFETPLRSLWRYSSDYLRSFTGFHDFELFFGYYMTSFKMADEIPRILAELPELSYLALHITSGIRSNFM